MTVKLFYVLDTSENCIITPCIPQKSDFIAKVSFANQFIKTKDPLKNPYNYKKLSLVRFAEIEDSGEDMCILNDDVVVYPGSKILEDVTNEMKERGIDDYFIDEEEK